MTYLILLFGWPGVLLVLGILLLRGHDQEVRRRRQKRAPPARTTPVVEVPPRRSGRVLDLE